MRIIEQVEGRYVEEIEGPYITCPSCGCGVVLGSDAACGQTEPGMCACGGLQVLVPEQRVRRYVPGYTLVRCSCGREVLCDGFTNPCACGADYDVSGTPLAPREQWGEETGESLADILGGGEVW